MLEVIIAILTITAFLTGTLQLMAVNALYKVRAERQAKANFWIQEDFEYVKALASSLDVKSSPDYVSTDVCTGTEGYATALRRQLTNTPIPNTSIPTEKLVETRPIVVKNYSLHRTFDITGQSANPHRLSINYRVEATDKNSKDYPNQENVIAESSVEVIPDASFKCPS
ncbi:MAG: type 4 pilin [Microcystis aeruginosa Ma_QC_Ch_20071001_S25]|uniref:Type 4 pilin n=1 Tax=Microcystis aeruginosa Ma_QC_Ch_20071001_S25D TaxID=2486250 RepID=A0A552FEI9_MICAE|nr:MAG: type 4 pilin [Microcystis aeruginosa Ma_QC_Ch_20071001_S25D]TRU49101.1 MAG: type 4 pilin [Microcystis aeruginosa Ma_QC_Ch_20071001_S25]TRU65805.1 MAG: type 4 pilin [Microcystis aeruginosa Ma_QC_Ch_20071001_M135]